MVKIKRKNVLFFLTFLFILAIAFFFRFWQLKSIPPGLYPDEAMNANDALTSFQTHKFKLFYPENNGREGLFIWLIALSFWLFKASIWSMRIVPAFFGFLTVIGIYLFTKEIFQNQNNKARIVALLASFFLAISFWHTNFSRIGFRAILVPFILVFAFYFIFSGFRQKKYLSLVAAGILFGLGFYTYIAYRFVVFLILIALFGWWLVYKKEKLEKKFLSASVCLLTTTFFTALPIGIYFLKNPQDFFGRASGVSVFSQKNPFLCLIKSIILHLGMFNFYGDGNWRHNFAGSPELLLPIGLLFILGFIISIIKLIQSFKSKNYQSFTSYLFIIVWFFTMLLPGILSYEGIPHSLRVLGVIPVVYIFTAIGSFWLYKKISFLFKTKTQKAILFPSLSIFLFSLTSAQFTKYFYQWAKRKEVKDAFAYNYVQIGEVLNSFSKDTQIYLIVNQNGVPVPFPNGISMPAQTPIFIERTKFNQPRAVYILPKDLNKIKINKNKENIIIPLQFDPKLFFNLHQKFPKGIIEQKNGITFYIIK